jgi:hypothetical protein
MVAFGRERERLFESGFERVGQSWHRKGPFRGRG